MSEMVPEYIAEQNAVQRAVSAERERIRQLAVRMQAVYPELNGPLRPFAELIRDPE